MCNFLDIGPKYLITLKILVSIRNKIKTTVITCNATFLAALAIAFILMAFFFQLI